MIRKNGVKCSAAYSTWTYLHPKMAEFKGAYVEVRYDENDLSKVWVFLPNGECVEAELLNRSSALPGMQNKQTVETVKRTGAEEKRKQREFEILRASQVRGETTEDRVAAQLAQEEEEEAEQAIAVGQNAPALAPVHKLTRFDRPRLKTASSRRAGPAAETIARVSREIEESGFELKVSRDDGAGDDVATVLCACGDRLDDHEFTDDLTYGGCSQCGCEQFERG
jgi:hypothetical protein